MRGAKEMIDVGEGGFGERAQSFARHHQHLFAEHALDPQPLGGDFAVGRRVLAERKQRRVLIGRQGMGGQGGVHWGCQRGW